MPTPNEKPKPKQMSEPSVSRDPVGKQREPKQRAEPQREQRPGGAKHGPAEQSDRPAGTDDKASGRDEGKNRLDQPSKKETPASTGAKGAEARSENCPKSERK